MVTVTVLSGQFSLFMSPINHCVNCFNVPSADWQTVFAGHGSCLRANPPRCLDSKPPGVLYKMKKSKRKKAKKSFFAGGPGTLQGTRPPLLCHRA